MNSVLAKQLFAEAITRHAVEPRTLQAEQRLLALKEAYLEHAERFVRGIPFVRLPPERVELNPIDPGDKPITSETLLTARDAELTSLATTPPRRSKAPVINLPGVHGASPGAATPLPAST